MYTRHIPFFLLLLGFIFPGCGEKKETEKTMMLYKIIPTSHFDKKNTKDSVKLLELDKKDNFIHCALKHQVTHILKKFFKDKTDIIILEIDPVILEQQGTQLRIEANKPGGEKFPHLYGTQKIPYKAVTKVIKPEEFAN